MAFTMTTTIAAVAAATQRTVAVREQHQDWQERTLREEGIVTV